MVKIVTKGDWSTTFKFLHKNSELSMKSKNKLIRVAQQGVDALSAATPKDTGLAASCWRYEIESTKGQSTITWTNDDIEHGYNVAILIQYGHGVVGGGYVQGRDFINPAIRPIFDNFAETLWREVSNA